MFVAGALLAKLAGLLIPWGAVLLVLGGVAGLQAVLIGLCVEIRACRRASSIMPSWASLREWLAHA